MYNGDFQDEREVRGSGWGWLERNKKDARFHKNNFKFCRDFYIYEFSRLLLVETCNSRLLVENFHTNLPTIDTWICEKR